MKKTFALISFVPVLLFATLTFDTSHEREAAVLKSFDIDASFINDPVLTEMKKKKRTHNQYHSFFRAMDNGYLFIPKITQILSKSDKLKIKKYKFIMKRKTIIGLIAIVAIATEVMFSGCVEEGGETAKPAGQAEKVTEESKQMELLATAVSGSVMTMTKNWDADAEDDGIVVYPALKDSSGEIVKFEGVELPVDIKVYTTKYTEDFKEVKDRLVYSGTATIDSWKDGNFLFEGGIKIPFEDINTVGSDKDYGWVYTTITLPDGRTIEAVDKLARIKPE